MMAAAQRSELARRRSSSVDIRTELSRPTLVRDLGNPTACNCWHSKSARTGTRTRTPLRERDFKSLASTRFAIPALLEIQRREPKSMVERAYTQSLEPPHSNPRLPY